MPTVLPPIDFKAAAADQLTQITDPLFESLKTKLADAMGPAIEKAKPYIEDTLKTVVLPEVITWGGLFLIVSVALGALVGSVVATRRQYRSNPRRLSRPHSRRRLAYA